MGEDAEAVLRRLGNGARRCRACPLREGRIRAVPGEGASRPLFVLVGEAPGKREDETGLPFCGSSGRLLDGLLEKAGLEREALFVTSAVKCRPPDNRNPRRGELRTCTERWLFPQLEALAPAPVVLLGRVAMEAVLGIREALTSVRGKVRRREGRAFLVTYHPAAALRDPRRKAPLVRDLEKAARHS